MHGAVKPWHVLFLYFVSFSVAIVGAFEATRRVEGSFRGELREVATQAIAAAIILAFTVVVPEFRRSLAALFVRPVLKPSASDIAATFALTLAWGYGLYRVGICLPIIVAHPPAFDTLHYADALARFDARYLVFLIGLVVVAPIGEELVFRGYLLNLWITRRGVWSAVILSSLVFGAFHFERAIFAAPMGLVLALVYLRYDSLWPGIFLHATYNLLSFPWLLGGIFVVKRRDSIAQLSSWVPEAVLALLFIPLAVFFWRRFKPSSP